MIYRTRDAAIENIKKSFSNTSGDIISADDLFMAWGRNPEKREDNKSWLSNKLTHWKYHDLVQPIYNYKSGHRVLEKIQLTLTGKKAIGRIGENVESINVTSPINNGNGTTPSLKDVMEMVAELRKKNPDYEINFDVKLKNL